MNNRSVWALILALFCLVPMTGCSSKLSRLEAQHQIDVMLKPHPVGSKKVMLPGGVPGFELPNEDTVSSSSFVLAEHKEYGELAMNHNDPLEKSPSDEEYTIESLNKMG
jgi:hypothetical protein